MVGIAWDNPLLDSPAFFSKAPSAYLIFQTIPLHVYCRRKYQHSMWEFCIILFPAAQELGLIVKGTNHVIGLAKAGIDHNLFALWVSTRLMPLLHDFCPAYPR